MRAASNFFREPDQVAGNGKRAGMIGLGAQHGRLPARFDRAGIHPGYPKSFILLLIGYRKASKKIEPGILVPSGAFNPAIQMGDPAGKPAVDKLG